MAIKAESSSVVKKALKDEIIKRPAEGTDKFFMNKAKESVKVANRLIELEAQEGLPSLLWVINASYYSMFFAATALLAKYDKKISTEIGVHRLTYHAIVHYFVIEDNKLEKRFIENYRDLIEDAEEILQLAESKTEEFISSFHFEMSKRKKFTYNLGKNAERQKAKTSLERAKEFVKVVQSFEL
ncbi:MAG: hypothetical protein ACOCZ6_05245 [Nanoarchaeota archaeon]